MTTVEQPTDFTASDNLYTSDDDRLGNSPLLKPMKVNLKPSPSPPPAVALYVFKATCADIIKDPANSSHNRPQVSPESSPGPEPSEKRKSNRPKNKPSQGDAVLVSFMDNGRRPEIALEAAKQPLQPLASEDEYEEDSEKGAQISMVSNPDLAAIAAAAGALAQGLQESTEQDSATRAQAYASSAVLEMGDAQPMEDVKQTIPSVDATHTPEYTGQPSPDPSVKTENPPTAGELPPIRHGSPKSGMQNGNGAVAMSLPSLSESIGNLNHIPKTVAPVEASTFSQSPPNRPSLQFPPMGHVSPPRSPTNVFAPRRELPSPTGGRGHPYYYGHSRTNTADTPQYSSASDYNGTNTETPSTDNSMSTPANIIDRMSIDGITNPQIGGYQCTYPGCTAPPFQTQVCFHPSSCNAQPLIHVKYLLNSHANVHSSNRPHYCSVKGCPRSEGGKGFKRKNEMIRHGLVHDSPGYVCPFCPDREHKYPRPDNLQR